MCYLYYCQFCAKEQHEKCEQVTPSSPEGSFGGSACTCQCKGNSKWQEDYTKKFSEEFLEKFKQIEIH